MLLQNAKTHQKTRNFVAMSLKKKIQRQIKKMPKYQINEEAFQNQGLARSQAFGRNRALQMQEGNIEQDAANAGNEARNVSGNTTSLLSTIAAINANKNTNLRGLAQDEAAVQQQNVGQLYNANQAMIDEKDKAWNQNVYAPWAAQLQYLKEKKANRDAKWGSIAGGLLTAGASVLGGPIGGALVGKATSGLGQNTYSGGGNTTQEQDMYSNNSRYS
jgi:hypothetical protein